MGAPPPQDRPHPGFPAPALPLGNKGRTRPGRIRLVTPRYKKAAGEFPHTGPRVGRLECPLALTPSPSARNQTGRREPGPPGSI